MQNRLASYLGMGCLWLSAGVGINAVALGGCSGTEEPEATAGVLQSDELAESASEVRAELTVTELTGDAAVDAHASLQTRKVFATAAAYQAFFGAAAPSTVDFAAGEVVIFYAAGIQRTGGYAASISRVARSNSGKTIYVTTELSSPGPQCVVTQALTHPYVLAKVQAPAQIRYVRWDAADVVDTCGAPETNPCDLARCAAGTECIVLETYPPQAKCVPSDEGSAPASCAATTCLTGTTCIELQTYPPKAVCVPNATDGGSAGGESCGSITCAPGLVCCNASCGICTPPNQMCIQIACAK